MSDPRQIPESAVHIMSGLSWADIEETASKLGRLRMLGAKIQAGGPARWKALRDYYAELNEFIVARWPGPTSSYHGTDWLRIFTPIEEMAWNAIRYYGLPFYPQYPAGRFFVDFADPVRKIAVECDGKQWHDEVVDAARDAELVALGWTVHRFTGRQCMLPPDDPDSIDKFFEALRPGYYVAPQEDE